MVRMANLLSIMAELCMETPCIFFLMHFDFESMKLVLTLATRQSLIELPKFSFVMSLRLFQPTLSSTRPTLSFFHWRSTATWTSKRSWPTRCETSSAAGLWSPHWTRRVWSFPAPMISSSRFLSRARSCHPMHMRKSTLPIPSQNPREVLYFKHGTSNHCDRICIYSKESNGFS